MNYSAAVLPHQYSFFSFFLSLWSCVYLRYCVEYVFIIWTPYGSCRDSASSLVRTCIKISCVDRLYALTEGGKNLGVRSFHSGDPAVIMSRLTCSTPSVPSVLYCTALYWQTHLPGRLTCPPTADDTSVNQSTKVVLKGAMKRSCRDSD